MLQLGHAKVSDFITAYGSTKPKPNGAISDDAPISSIDSLKSVMAEMLKSRFLIPVQDYHMHPRTDTINTMRAQLTSQLRGSFQVETKLAKEVDRQMKIKLAEMADGDTSETAGMKRKAVALKGRSKKRQKVSVYDEEQEEEEWEIDVGLPDLITAQLLTLYRRKLSFV